MIYIKTKITCREGYSEYEIDTNGVVYSKSGKPLKPSINHSGYNMINLMINNKRTGVAIHRLVAEQFIENKENKPTVNHIDGNKNNGNYIPFINKHKSLVHAVVKGHRKSAGGYYWCYNN